MKHIDPKIIKKIKKCLALASSNNPHEAATAMRQAKAMMAAHGISDAHIHLGDIKEATAKSRTMAYSKPASWEIFLASIVGRSFGCEIILSKKATGASSRGVTYKEANYKFIGVEQQVEIASYVFDVLARKCKKARADWLSDSEQAVLREIYRKREITALGDEFAIGWVSKIRQLVQDFSNPEHVQKAIAAYMQNLNTEDEAQHRAPKTKDASEIKRYAQYQGQEAAKGESLYRPMSTREQAKLSAD